MGITVGKKEGQNHQVNTLAWPLKHLNPQREAFSLTTVVGIFDFRYSVISFYWLRVSA